jgi:aspartyl-tRNA synthetase
MNDIVATSGVKVFASVIEKGGEVKCLNAKGCGTWTRKEIDDLGPYAARYGAKGLAWIQVKDGEFKGPIVKFFTEEEIAAVKERTGAEEGDLLLFSADTKEDRCRCPWRTPSEDRPSAWPDRRQCLQIRLGYRIPAAQL